jgi:hypothetical protein
MRIRIAGRTGAVASLSLVLAFLAAVLTGTPARAHVFQTSDAIVFFDRDATSFAVRLDLNLEAIMSGIDPEVRDTSESPNAPEYNRLRALSPEQFQVEFSAFRDAFLAGIVVELDGARVYPPIATEEFRDAGDLTKARNTTLRLKGELPAGASVFRIGWDAKFGKLSVRTISVRARSLHIEILEKGAKSSPMVIDDLKARTMFDMIVDFVIIGFEHIVPLGIDHILFVFGIFLLSTKLRPILIQVTSFTVAHTLTLGLGTLGYVNLPPAVVEPLIAASIVYVAVENIWRPTLSPWRPAVVFLFGLLHGLGFAGILREFALPEGEFVVGLLSFNLGVELGQLAVISLGFALVGIWFGNKPWYRRAIVIPGSLAIAAVGAWWAFERTFL